MSEATRVLTARRPAAPRRPGWRRALARVKTMTWFDWAIAVVGVAVAILVFFPILGVIFRLFVTDGRINFSPIVDAVTSPDLLDVLADTTIVVVVSGAIALVVGSGFAWLNERTNARMGLVTDVLPIVNFLIPAIAGAVGWLMLLSPKAGYLNGVIRGVLSFFGIKLTEGPLNIQSWGGVLFVYTLSLVPFAFLAVTAGLRGIDSSLEEQSQMCGASLGRTLRKVTLPLIRPSLAGAMFLMAWFGLALFSVPLVIAQPAGIDMISVRIVELLTFVYPPKTGEAVALGFFALVVLLTIWLLQRRALKGGRIAMIGAKGARQGRLRLGPWKVVARIFMLAYLAVAVIFPLGALALVSLNGFWTLKINWGGLGLESIQSVFANPSVQLAFRNSSMLAALTATAAIVVASIVALGRRSNSPVAGLADTATKFPAAVSSIVIAVGFILAFGGNPFFLGGTLLILLLAYLVLGLPEASVTTDSAFGQVGKDVVEASQMSGASALRTYLKVYLPLTLPGLVAGWALVFVRIVGDIEASAILAGTGNTVIGFEILGIYRNGGYDTLAVLALTTALMSTTVLVVLFFVSGRLTPWRTKTARRATRRQIAERTVQ